MMKCGECGKDVVTVDDVRGCQMCHRNGTAALVHCEHAGSDPIEAETAALPFSVVEVVESEDPPAVAEAVAEPPVESTTKPRKKKKSA